jgi:diamine N-acetyltransferase
VWIWRLMVGFAHHGQGIGEAALKFAETYARSRPGATLLKLCHVPHENGPQGFYERHGFTHTGEEDDGELVMQKLL